MNRKQRRSLSDSLDLNLTPEAEAFLDLNPLRGESPQLQSATFDGEAEALLNHLDTLPNGDILRLIYEFIYRQNNPTLNPFEHIYSLESGEREGSDQLSYLRLALQGTFSLLTKKQAKSLLRDLFADWVEEWQEQGENSAYTLDADLVARWEQAIA